MTASVLEKWSVEREEEPVDVCWVARIPVLFPQGGEGAATVWGPHWQTRRLFVHRTDAEGLLGDREDGVRAWVSWRERGLLSRGSGGR